MPDGIITLVWISVGDIIATSFGIFILYMFDNVLGSLPMVHEVILAGYGVLGILDAIGFAAFILGIAGMLLALIGSGSGSSFYGRK